MTIKKLFKHCGSYAVYIPMEFIRQTGATEVIIESSPEGIRIRPNTELDTIEAEPIFEEFIRALAVDAMKHPERLHDVKEVWDQDWDELLKNVEVN
jgi:hypothetical protein